jgi:hypothetical protein
MHYLGIVALGVFAISAGGCTTSLSTEPDVYRTATPTSALKGIPYSLPMQQYDVTVTRTLTACPEGIPAPAATAADPATKRKDLTFSVVAEATPLIVAGEHYLIDYSALSNMMKTTSFAIEHYEKSRTLKSINVSADDKTDEVLKAVAKTALSIASIASPPNVVFGESAPPTRTLTTTPKVMCTEEAEKLLATSKAAKSDLETKTGLLTDTTAEISKLALLGAVSDAQKDRLFGLMQEQRLRSDAVDAARKALAKALEDLTITHKQRWPLAFNETRAESPLSDPMKVKLAMKLLEVRNTIVDPNKPVQDKCEGTEADVLECVVPKLATYLRLEPIDGATAPCDPAKPLVGCSISRTGYEARDAAADAGIFVRPPIDGRLVICKETEGCDSQSEAAILRGDAMPIPQLGQLRFLPFKNEIFENNQLALHLRENGMIEKFEYQNKSAAQRAALAASDIGSQIEKYYDERRAEEKQAAKDARELLAATRAEEAAVIQQQITLLTKEKELDSLKNPDPNAAVTADWLAQAALYKAELAAITAEEELAARKKP